MECALLWFRNDLRLADNPALDGLLRAGLAPIPVYIHAPEEEGDWAPGAASEAWRAKSLAALDADLRARGSRLQVLRGSTQQVLAQLVAETDAKAVYWNRRYEPAIEARDGSIKQALRADGIAARSHNGALLFEPWQVQSLAGDPYKVFTPFWRTALKQWRLPAVAEAGDALPAPPMLANALALGDLGLAPRPPWDRGFWDEWKPGEAGAHAALEKFANETLDGYVGHRDIPSLRGTSRLSPHLHFGEIAPWRIAHRLQDVLPARDREGYLREIGWREFAHHLLHHFPHTPSANFNPRFDDFDWASPSDAQLDAWRHGQTGIPIVDAGMRELWATGWMHNRVRMIVGSFLSKHMRLHWLPGARWFWDTLVDADLASNTLGWQWVAGTGADAAPYHRVFNPVLQAEKFDPRGDYIARWVPELAGLPAARRHAPWTGAIPKDYPRPVVDLAEGRADALAALAAIKRA
jgi:deoxyribodipyrimidine photo-lyase